MDLRDIIAISPPRPSPPRPFLAFLGERGECRKDKRIVDDLLVAELAKSSGICWRFIGSLGDFRDGFSLTLRHSAQGQWSQEFP